MQYRLKCKKEPDRYYVPGNANGTIPTSVGKVYNSIATVRRNAVRGVEQRYRGNIEDWEIVEFISKNANGKVFPLVDK